MEEWIAAIRAAAANDFYDVSSVTSSLYDAFFTWLSWGISVYLLAFMPGQYNMPFKAFSIDLRIFCIACLLVFERVDEMRLDWEVV